MLALWFQALFFLAVEGAHIPRYAQIVGRGIPLSASYDFVIIGGGTSGLTVADRLTEDPSSKISLAAASLKAGAPFSLFMVARSICHSD